MKTGDKVRCGDGKKVHRVKFSGVDMGLFFIQCREGQEDFYKPGHVDYFRLTTDSVDCKKCLKKLEGR